LPHQGVINGRGDPHHIADAADPSDMKGSPLGAGIDYGDGQIQVPLWAIGHVASELLERFSVVFAKLLDLLSLVHGLSLMRMGSELNRSASREAELQIKACSVSLATFLDQERHTVSPPGRHHRIDFIR
tara:strand:- start:189 stop:575 length:387 start_codon:yes stop_codon:yes gene_type:complete